MPERYKKIVISQAFCDVCGEGPLSAYTAVRDNTIAKPENPKDGQLDPRVKVVLCYKHGIGASGTVTGV